MRPRESVRSSGMLCGESGIRGGERGIALPRGFR